MAFCFKSKDGAKIRKVFETKKKKAENFVIIRLFITFAGMMVTVEFLNQKFAEMNGLCFGGELPMVSIRLSKARTYLGQLGYKRKRTLLGKCVGAKGSGTFAPTV